MTTNMDKLDRLKSDNQSQTQLSEIQMFYKDATVFLTGATGFLGILILEKLIRTCSDVKRIYILIREKKGKTPIDRFEDLFDDPVFEIMKREQPNYLEKIIAINGDCGQPKLGIEEKQYEILKNEVNIILHCAATVRFDEHLKKAVNINITSLQDILKLANELNNLKSFVHVSTAYSNCAGRNVVDEIFYKPPITGDKLQQLVKSLDDDCISKLTPILLKEWPNTYTMTKAIAENELLTLSNGLPIGIIRPSMIIATFREPIPGWINNYYGPTGVVAASYVGLMRCMYADPQNIADIVPGDFVSNAVLACAWDVHNQWIKHNTLNCNIGKDNNNEFVPPIYNFTSSKTNPLKWVDFSNFNKRHGYKIPYSNTIWPLLFRISKNKYEYIILCFLLHTMPAIFLDSVAKVIGIKSNLMVQYKKLHTFSNVISYFSLRSWTFNDGNTRSLISRLSKLDKSLFNFDVSELNWDEYFEIHMIGIRVHILKDPLETLPEARRHMKRLNMAYYSIIVFFTISFLLILKELFFS